MKIRWVKFSLTGALMEIAQCAGPGSDQFNALLAVTSKVLIVRAEDNFYKHCIDYLGLSELFDEVEEGSVAPTYTLEVQSTAEPQPDGSTKMRYDVQAFRRSPHCPECGRLIPPMMRGSGSGTRIS